MLTLRKFGLINAPYRVDSAFGFARKIHPQKGAFSQADEEDALTPGRA